MINENLVLSAQNIVHGYAAENDVLKGVSLDAYRGDVVAILGGSGSGKSTLLRCLNLLETPRQGEIYFLNEHLEFVTDKHGTRRIKSPKQLLNLRTQLGMVFQQFNLWSHKTVLQNIIEAPRRVLKQDKDAALATARKWLKKVGLGAEFEASYPAQLSGGQQQRVAIARTMAMDPAMILLDEPTSALDPTLVNEVLRVITQLAEEKCTMLVVTHELEFARKVASRVVFLHEGVIAAAGTPQQIFAKDNSNQLLRDFLQHDAELKA